MIIINASLLAPSSHFIEQNTVTKQFIPIFASCIEGLLLQFTYKNVFKTSSLDGFY